jgi:hypothetical protein
MDVKKKIIVDLFSAPSVLAPLFIGATSLIAGWALETKIIIFGGILGLGISAGSLMMRLIFGLDKIAKDAFDHQIAVKQKAEESRFNLLVTKLKHCSRAVDCLQKIQSLKQQFAQDLEEGKLSAGAYAAADTINTILDACVRQLETLSDSIPPDILLAAQKAFRKKGAESRASRRIDPTILETIEEVEETVDHAKKAIDEFRVYATDKTKKNLSSLRSELDQALKVAKGVDKKLSSLDENPVYNQHEFE